MSSEPFLASSIYRVSGMAVLSGVRHPDSDARTLLRAYPQPPPGGAGTIKTSIATSRQYYLRTMYMIEEKRKVRRMKTEISWIVTPTSALHRRGPHAQMEASRSQRGGLGHSFPLCAAPSSSQQSTYLPGRKPTESQRATRIPSFPKL